MDETQTITPEMVVNKVELMRLRPGDLLVFIVPEDTPIEVCNNFAKSLRKQLDRNGHGLVEGLIMYGDIGIKIVRATEDES